VKRQIKIWLLEIKMKKMLQLLLMVAIGITGIPIAQGATAARVLTTQSYTANISGVGNIWKSEIPNSIAFPANESYVELEFPIQGLLPYKTLSDRSTGVDIEFELWSTSGTKIASRSVYSSVWNPAGPDTLISFTLFQKDLFGDLVLRVSTQYKVSTNGLLSRYLSTETKIPFKIEGMTLPTTKISGATIEGSEEYLGTIPSVGNIWKGKIPTKLSYPLSSSYQTAYFYIQGLLPYSTLADKATGVEVEFELWNSKGKKISDDTVYSFDWNPVGLNTMVSLRLSEDDAIGNHTLIIRTIYEVSTTGLLTRYLEQEDKRQVTIVSRKKDQVIEFKQISDISLDKGSFTLYSSDLSSSEYSLKPLLSSATPGVCTANDRKVTLLNAGTCTLTASQSGSDSVGPANNVSVSFKVLAGKPRTPTEFTGSRQGNSVIYSIGGSYSDGTSFDVSISPILTPTASPTSQNSFYGPAVWKTVAGSSFTIDGPSLNSYFNGIILPYSKYKSIVLVRVRATNSLGSSDWSSGIYSYVRDFGLVESGSKTITCVKGKTTKKVTGTNPKCPSGYKKS
jgi:hypothetical protein